MTAPDWLLVFLVCWAIYSYICFRLVRYIQPLRLKLAEYGEDFLAKPEVPDELKQNTKFMLDNAFSRWVFVGGIIFTPIAAIVLATNQQKRQSQQKIWENAGHGIRAEYRQLTRMFTASAAAANPLLAAIWYLERILLELVILLMGRTIRATELITLSSVNFGKFARTTMAFRKV